MAASCQGVEPRRLTVEVDGKMQGSVDIPCATAAVAARERFWVQSFVLGGEHLVRVFDLRTVRAATRRIVVPQTGSPTGYTQVWAQVDADGIQIGAALPSPLP